MIERIANNGMYPTELSTITSDVLTYGKGEELIVINIISLFHIRRSDVIMLNSVGYIVDVSIRLEDKMTDFSVQPKRDKEETAIMTKLGTSVLFL